MNTSISDIGHFFGGVGGGNVSGFDIRINAGLIECV